jgi:hypothetical protein
MLTYVNNGLTAFDSYSNTTLTNWDTILFDVLNIDGTVSHGFKTMLTQVDGMNTMLTTNWDTLLNQVSNIDELLKNYVKEFTDYFINHSVYYGNRMTADDVRRIQNEERGETGTAIVRLAEVLTSNSEDLTDPTVQTNALLAQILLVATNILNQGTQSGNQMLGDTMNELSVGLIRRV